MYYKNLCLELEEFIHQQELFVLKTETARKMCAKYESLIRLEVRYKHILMLHIDTLVDTLVASVLTTLSV